MHPARSTYGFVSVLLSIALGALVLLGPGHARAADWLVFLVDRSNSIDDGELRLQREAYMRLLSDPQVIDALGPTQVAIIEFDSDTHLMVNWTDAATAARRYRRNATMGQRSQTGIGAALARAIRMLADKPGRLVVDVSGDGEENVNKWQLKRARAAAAKLAVEVNGLAIPSKRHPELPTYYSQYVANGFVVQVERGGDFYGALKRKLLFEVAGARPIPQQSAASVE